MIEGGGMAVSTCEDDIKGWNADKPLLWNCGKDRGSMGAAESASTEACMSCCEAITMAMQTTRSVRTAA